VTQLVDLDRLEKQAFRKFYDDGIFDIFFGLLIAAMSLGSVIQDALGSEAVSLIVMAGSGLVLVVVFMTARRRVVLPRLGRFTPGPARRRRISVTRVILLCSAALGVAAFGLAVVAEAEGAAPGTVEIVLPIVWFVNATVVLGAMAYLLDVPRFALYGVLFGLVGPVMIWPDVLWDFRVLPPAAFAIPAVPMLVTGIRLLRRFLHEHPVRQIPKEPADGGSH